MPVPGVESDEARSLQELDGIRRRVIAVVGHELRTPVTTLRGLTSQLASADAEQIRDVLAPALDRNARRLEGLLDALLVASEISTALPVGDLRPVAVAPAARAVWEALAPGRPLDVAGQGDLEVAVRGDGLDRIFGHLFDNALKYGRPPPTLHVGAGEGALVEIDLHSPGDPVPDSDLDLAFELFYRGERAVTSSPGLGIGLPAARALARQDGGDLRLAPRPGGGVVMHLTLPAADR